MDILHIGKCQYEIQEQKEVLVWYTSKYQTILSARFTLKVKCLRVMEFFHYVHESLGYKQLNDVCLKCFLQISQ
jgi:hypothetical protein